MSQDGDRQSQLSSAISNYGGKAPTDDRNASDLAHITRLARDEMVRLGNAATKTAVGVLVNSTTELVGYVQRQGSQFAMSTWLQERQQDLMHALHQAQKHFDGYVGDVNGHTDIVRRVARLTEQLHELGVTVEQFNEYVAHVDAEDARSKQAARERAYERTGVCQ